MRAYSMTHFKQHAEKIVEETIEDCDETIITLDNGEAAVIIPMREYSSWKETEYLLSNPANAERLRRSIQSIREGKNLIHKTIEELEAMTSDHLRPSDP